VYWVLVEQPGPWGRDALTQSHLAPDFGRALTDWASTAAADAPVRVGVIRRPGRHADSLEGITSRTVLIAASGPEQNQLQIRRVDDAREILTWDLPSLMGSPQQETNGTNGTNAATATNALLICTNARRDQCCALLGRPLAAQLAQQTGASNTQVWETSHLGGHRFAPTLVDLPSGYLFGGSTASTRSVDACRGRSSLPPPAQAAELAVMRQLEWTHPSPLAVRGGDGGGDYTVTAPDHTTFHVSVVQQVLPPRPESCGKARVPGISWRAAITR